MEIRAGYKNSEMGPIPNDWDVVLLNDLAIKIGSGITPTGGSSVYKEDGRPLVRSQNIGWGKLLLDDIAFIDDETHQSFPNTEIKLHDVFLNISGASIGRSSYANEQLVGGNVNQHVCIIRLIDKKLNPVYLNLFLLSKYGQKQIDIFQSGGNRQGLNIGQIKTFKIPVPPKSEQTAIATALSDTDALIGSLEKLITKKRNIKQGAMQKLLQPKEGWEVKKLGEICQIFKGKGISKSQVTEGGKYECILYGELFTTYKEVITNVVSRTNVDESIFSKVGDILYPGSTTTTGIDLAKASAIMNDNVLLGSDIVVLRQLNYIYSPIFLSYFLNEIKKFEIAQTTKGITIHHLYGRDLAGINAEFPSIQEQEKIATILTDMDAEIDALETKLEKFKKVKLGMMQNLLTGKIRLV